MITVPYPRVMPKNFMTQTTESKIIYPVRVTIDESIEPVSTATITMPRDGTVLGRDVVFKLYKATGEAGYFRVQSIDIDYSSNTIVYQLESMFAEVGDWCIMQKQSGSYSAANAIRRLWRGSDASATSDDGYRGSDWVLGDMTALTGTVELQAANRSNLLTSILDVLGGLPSIYLDFDWSDWPWKVNFKALDESADGIAHGRLDRNIGGARISLDYTDLCTRVRYYYDSSWRQYTADQEHQDAYGIVEEKLDVNGAETLARAQYMAKEHLEKMQDPRTSISLTAYELSAITGVKADEFKIGKIFELHVPEFDYVLRRNITRMTWNDVYGDPLNVNITLGEDDPSLWAYLKPIKKK